MEFSEMVVNILFQLIRQTFVMKNSADVYLYCYMQLQRRILARKFIFLAMTTFNSQEYVCFTQIFLLVSHGYFGFLAWLWWNLYTIEFLWYYPVTKYYVSFLYLLSDRNYFSTIQILRKYNHLILRKKLRISQKNQVWHYWLLSYTHNSFSYFFSNNNLIFLSYLKLTSMLTFWSINCRMFWSLF